jgi:hypothetical protein
VPSAHPYSGSMNPQVASPASRSSRGNRALRATLVSSALASIATITGSALADVPERPSGFFPTCVSEQDTFCIESATKGGTDILGTSYYVNASFLDANSINWSLGVGSPYGELPTEDLGATFHFVIRTGDMQPLYTYAIADQFHLSAGGDAESGYRITIEGTIATIHWNFETGFSCTTVDCGDELTQATPIASGRRLSGNTQNMALWAEEERSRFGGTYVATNAQALSTVLLFEQYPTPRWYLDLANPHLDTEGNPVTGSFTAWVPPSYFEAIGTTAGAAVEAGFDVTRTESGIAEPLSATIALDSGGTLVRVPSVSYSAPRITVAQSVPGSGSVDAGTPGNDGPDAGYGPDAGSGGSAGEGEGGTGGSVSAAGGGGYGGTDSAGGSDAGGSGSGGSGSGGAESAAGSGSGGSGSGGAESAAGSGSGGSGSGGAESADGGDSGSTSVGGHSAGGGAQTGGNGGATAAQEPDTTPSAAGATASPATANSGKSSKGCALGAPSDEPYGALGAGVLLSVLVARRRPSRHARRG